MSGIGTLLCPSVLDHLVPVVLEVVSEAGCFPLLPITLERLQNPPPQHHSDPVGPSPGRVRLSRVRRLPPRRLAARRRTRPDVGGRRQRRAGGRRVCTRARDAAGVRRAGRARAGLHRRASDAVHLRGRGARRVRAWVGALRVPGGAGAVRGVPVVGVAGAVKGGDGGRIIIIKEMI